MARYNDAVCKLCRREGEKLFLKGERCLTPKCALERRPYPPGLHGRQAQFRRKVSDYGLQLRAKQKAKRVYGVLERQFRRYFREAERRRGLTGTNLLILLESRLDNVVYRLGFATSRPQARQFVRHGHFEVNGRKVNIPSYLVQQGDVVAVRPNSRSKPVFKEVALDLEHRTVPDWLSRDDLSMSGRVMSQPERGDIDVTINEQLIVEYYSR
ncbi:MAG TPA: 30S ribosomal protein S4 [Anaerolineae bacterium]|nr:30S ribosomal protein S4 [Anaerolineae bacterium]